MTAPVFRAVDQHTGNIATAEAFAAAVGVYDCPCGSMFEFGEHDSLEDYAALNRWLGEHVGQCGGGEIPAVAQRDAVIADAVVQVERLRAELDAERCRVQKLEAENRELTTDLATVRAERDTARAAR